RALEEDPQRPVGRGFQGAVEDLGVAPAGQRLALEGGQVHLRGQGRVGRGARGGVHRGGPAPSSVGVVLAPSVANGGTTPHHPAALCLQDDGYRGTTLLARPAGRLTTPQAAGRGARPWDGLSWRARPPDLLG